MEKMIFTSKDPLREFAIKDKKILNFLNLYSLYLFHNNTLFRQSVSGYQVLNFPDGTFIEKRLRSRRARGAAVTRRILMSSLSKNKKHFFLGMRASEISKFSKKTAINSKNIATFNPSFISGTEFSKDEMEEIIKEVNNFQTDYLWVCIGNPKQEILAHQIFAKIQCEKILCIGAAIDFLLGRKSEAPMFFRKAGLEWIYLLFTNPKRTFIKVWKSFLGLRYLFLGVELK